MDKQQLRDAFGKATKGGTTPLAVADQLCAACVELLPVDGASISLIDGGTIQGTFGSSGRLSRTLDELQFTYGQGPCLDAVEQRRPVLAPDLSDPRDGRWPALTRAILGHGIQAVFALPVGAASATMGALDLYRRDSGPLDGAALYGGMWAAGLAVLPLLDLAMSVTEPIQTAPGQTGQDLLASLERVEIYQATGMIISALGISPADALIRIRAYAISHSLTSSQVAFSILSRRLVLDKDDWYETVGDEGEAT